MYAIRSYYDFLRVFWARLGRFHCPQCDKPIRSQTVDEIVQAILALAEGTKFLLMAPLAEQKKGTFKDLLAKLKKEGFARVRVNGEVLAIEEVPDLDKKKKHSYNFV